MRHARAPLRQLRTLGFGTVGLAMCLLIVLGSALAPVVAPFDSLESNFSDSLQAPSSVHYFGTDELGRDILSEILWGGRTTLLVVFLSVAISILIGLAVGSLSGYLGGAFDAVTARGIDAFLVIPSAILAIVVAAVLGPSLINIVLALSIVFWPVTARIVRGEYLALKNLPFVKAAEMAGLGRLKIVFVEMLPAVSPLIIVNAAFLAGEAILAEAGLSFLGLQDPDVSSWGKMVFDSKDVLRHAWWTAVFPGLAIVVLVFGANLLGDAINDRIRPSREELLVG